LLGAYQYYTVLTLFLRPIVLLVSAVTTFKTVENQSLGETGSVYWCSLIALIIAILAFLYSFPFMVCKGEEASYLVKVKKNHQVFSFFTSPLLKVISMLIYSPLLFPLTLTYLIKIHYPFLLSNAAGDAKIRAAMFDVLQNLKEEIAILTILLGSVTEVLLITGNFILSLSQFLSPSGINYPLVTVAYLNLLSALYSFYCYCIFCMKIMTSRAHDSAFYRWCCCVCYGCLKAEAYARQDLAQADKFDFGDTALYTMKDIPSTFKSKDFISKYTIKDDESSSAEKGQQGESALYIDLDAIQQEVPLLIGDIPQYRMRDRYGFLSIPGDAKLITMNLEDAVQLAKEEYENSGGLCPAILAGISAACGQICPALSWACAKFLQIFNIVGYCITLLMMYFISLGYAMCSGVCIAIEWYFYGFDVERHLKEACDRVDGNNKNLFKSIHEIVVEDTNGKVVETIQVIVPIKDPMPWGLAFLGPIVKSSATCYNVIRWVWPLTCCKPALKYNVNKDNILAPHLVANIILHSEAIIPHSLLQGFPFTWGPLKRIYNSSLIDIGTGLQYIVDLIEFRKLQQLNLVPADGILSLLEKPSDEAVRAIQLSRSGVKVVAATAGSPVAAAAPASAATDKPADKPSSMFGATIGQFMKR
jgi:hypothetical protein